jgi:hypothetical protein
VVDDCICVRGMQGYAESKYFIDRVKMLAQGGRIYQDFEFAYGALFLYGPRILMGFRLSVELSYFCFGCCVWREAYGSLP